MKTTYVFDPMSATLLLHHISQDLLSAIGHIKHGNAIANEHRKKAASLPFRLAGYVTGSSGANWVKSMTPVERHAELVYAESLFEKVIPRNFCFVYLRGADSESRPYWGSCIPATGLHLSRKRTDSL
jgi:hypothetical protein